MRHRWISAVLLGTTLSALVGLSMWYLLTPRYTAFSQLQVGYVQDSFFQGPNATAGDFKTYLKTTADELMSRQVIQSALKREEVKRLGLDSKEVDPGQAIAEDLRVEFKENSELLTLLYSHFDAQVARTVVNAIKEAYLEDIVYAKRNARARRVTELEKVYGEASEALKTKKENLKKVGQNLGTTDPNLWREQRLETVQALRDAKREQIQVGFELIKARSMLDTLDLRVKALAKTSTSGSTTKATTDLPAFEEALEIALEKDPEAQQLRKRLIALETEVEDLLAKGYRPDYVSVKIGKHRAAMVQTSLKRRREVVAERVRKALDQAGSTANGGASGTPGSVSEDPVLARAQLQKQVDALTGIEDNLRKEIARLSKEAAKTPVLAAEYEQLADEVKQDEKILAELRSRLERERVELRAASRIRSFQNAELMKRDTKKQILAAGVSPLAVFVAVSMGLAWLEFRKRRIRSAAEISRGLGIRVVGAVPRMPQLERQLVGPSGETELEGTPVMESIDAIRTRLLYESSAHSTRVVMVTSAGFGEGKTTLASALAASLARAGRRTLLLDGDLRRPALHELFEVAIQPGFSEVLLGEIEVAEAAQEAPQENLWILPAGQWDREVLLALSRDGLEGVFERLVDEFDFIVVDSHPVLEATDSLLLGKQADAVLLSVLREVSQIPRVYAASQQLSAVGIRVLGAVVNGTNPEEVYTSTAAVPAGVA